MKKKLELLKKENKSLKKATNANDEKQNDYEEEEEEHVPVEALVHTQKSLNIKSVTELKDMCKIRGIGGYSGKIKADLITFMLNHKKFV